MANTNTIVFQDDGSYVYNGTVVPDKDDITYQGSLTQDYSLIITNNRTTPVTVKFNPSFPPIIPTSSITLKTGITNPGTIIIDGQNTRIRRETHSLFYMNIEDQDTILPPVDIKNINIEVKNTSSAFIDLDINGGAKGGILSVSSPVPVYSEVNELGINKDVKIESCTIKSANVNIGTSDVGGLGEVEKSSNGGILGCFCVSSINSSLTIKNCKFDITGNLTIGSKQKYNGGILGCQYLFSNNGQGTVLIENCVLDGTGTLKIGSQTAESNAGSDNGGVLGSKLLGGHNVQLDGGITEIIPGNSDGKITLRNNTIYMDNEFLVGNGAKNCGGIVGCERVSNSTSDDKVTLEIINCDFLIGKSIKIGQIEGAGIPNLGGIMGCFDVSQAIGTKGKLSITGCNIQTLDGDAQIGYSADDNGCSGIFAARYAGFGNQTYVELNIEECSFTAKTDITIGVNDEENEANSGIATIQRMGSANKNYTIKNNKVVTQNNIIINGSKSAGIFATTQAMNNQLTNPAIIEFSNNIIECNIFKTVNATSGSMISDFSPTTVGELDGMIFRNCEIKFKELIDFEGLEDITENTEITLANSQYMIRGRDIEEGDGFTPVNCLIYTLPEAELINKNIETRTRKIELDSTIEEVDTTVTFTSDYVEDVVPSVIFERDETVQRKTVSEMFKTIFGKYDILDKTTLMDREFIPLPTAFTKPVILAKKATSELQQVTTQDEDQGFYALLEEIGHQIELLSRDGTYSVYTRKENENDFLIQHKEGDSVVFETTEQVGYGNSFKGIQYVVGSLTAQENDVPDPDPDTVSESSIIPTVFLFISPIIFIILLFFLKTINII